MGMGASPATEKVVVSPSQRDRVSVDGAKISEIRSLKTRPGADVAGTVKALSVDMS